MAACLHSVPQTQTSVCTVWGVMQSACSLFTCSSLRDNYLFSRERWGTCLCEHEQGQVQDILLNECFTFLDVFSFSRSLLAFNSQVLSHGERWEHICGKKRNVSFLLMFVLNNLYCLTVYWYWIYYIDYILCYSVQYLKSWEKQINSLL